MSTKQEVLLEIQQTAPFDLVSFSEDGQWKLEDTSAQNIKDTKRSTVRYSLKVRRRRTFYLINIILPIFFLSMMASLIFVLPSDEGEKMGTGITVVLAFAVYLTIVSDIVPKTSLQVSILGIYLTFLLGLSASSLIICAFVLRIHHRVEPATVGPRWRQAVRIMSKMCCMGPAKRVPRNSVSPVIGDHDETVKDTCHKTNLVDPVTLDQNSVSLEEELTWTSVAATIDWFCFLCFTVTTIVTTLTCLCALEVGPYIKQL